MNRETKAARTCGTSVLRFSLPSNRSRFLLKKRLSHPSEQARRFRRTVFPSERPILRDDP